MLSMKLVFATALVAALSLSAASGAAASGSYDRTCGLLPGDGGFGYVRAANATCRRAWKVTRKSQKKFCKQHHDCRINWKNNIGKLYKGTVKRNGWRCKVTVGWEYYRTKCRKGNMRVISRGGA